MRRVSVFDRCVPVAVWAALALLGTASSAVGQTGDEFPSLQEELDAKAAEAAEGAPPQMLERFEGAIAEIGRSIGLEQVIDEGDRAPDFRLPNATGEPVRLSELLSEGPVVLTWYRGSWCPFCNIQLHAYQQVLPALQAAGAQLVAISPELPDSTLSWQQKNALEFQVLSDAGNRVAREYGVVYELPPQIRAMYSGEGRVDLTEINGDDSLTLPLAVTYVIDSGGTVTYAFIDTDYRNRAEPSVLVREVNRLIARD